MGTEKDTTPVGNFLRKKRIERALSQEKVAKLVGCSRSTISNIEIHKHEIPRYTRNLFVGALKLTDSEIKEFDSLLEDTDSCKCTGKKPNITDDLALAVTHIVQYLNVDQKTKIYKFLCNDLGLD